MDARRLSYWLLGIVVAGCLSAVVIWQMPALLSTPLPEVLSLEAGDQEIALLQPATNASDWERFLQAALHVKGTIPLAIDTTGAFPEASAAVPEIGWRVESAASSIRVRWYKLTSSTDVTYWISKLAKRKPPPLAIIGGDNSNRAASIAEALQARFERMPAGPRLLLTTATAEKVAQRELMYIYPERTFRFCFTNRQMAQAIVEFLWSRPELHLFPDSGPVYFVDWQDNSYSLDLVVRFREALPQLTLAPVTDTGRNREPYWYQSISHSIGMFGRPSAEETAAAEALLNELERRPGQQHALLVLPANSWPARRFLHALSRAAPAAISRFTVVNGDAIDFNTVYRDGYLTWPVQDLPFQLVFFCHRNPIDRNAGFRAVGTNDVVVQDLAYTTAADTGTYDLLLYADIIAAITSAAFQDGRLLNDVQAFDQNLRTNRFDAKGNRLERTGEHVVCLQPVRSGDRVLPRSQLRVYGRMPGGWDLQHPEFQLFYGVGEPPLAGEAGP